MNERGACRWVLRIKVGDKRRDRGLGGFPDGSLASAREAARAALAQVEEGIDPVAQARDARGAIWASQAAAKTFRFCALAYIDAHEAEDGAFPSRIKDLAASSLSASFQ